MEGNTAFWGGAHSSRQADGPERQELQHGSFLNTRFSRLRYLRIPFW